MMSSKSWEELEKLLRSFYSITGIRMGVFAQDGREIHSYPSDICEFCRRVKSDARFAKRCMQCDQEAINQAMMGKTWIYRCHAGLCEAVAPIMCYGQPIACLMIGQVAPHIPPEKTEREIGERLQGHPDREEIFKTFSHMQHRQDAELEACANIMAACAGYIYLKQMVQPSLSLTARLQQLIEERYTQPLTVKSMAAALHMGVTSLCSGIRKECGNTPHEMLLAFRMEKARRLLRESTFSVQAIAQQVGMTDYNYFSRVFKRREGVTPTAFRAGKKPTFLPD